MRGMNSVIVRELRRLEPLDPVVLMIANEEAEVRLHLLIVAFGETVGLWMVRGRRVADDAQLIHERTSELRNEDGAAVANDLTR